MHTALLRMIRKALRAAACAGACLLLAPVAAVAQQPAQGTAPAYADLDAALAAAVRAEDAADGRAMQAAADAAVRFARDFTDDDPRRGAAMARLAQALLLQGRHEQAELLFADAIPILTAGGADWAPLAVEAAGARAEALIELGRREEAAALLVPAQAQALRIAGPGSRLGVRLTTQLAYLHVRDSRLDAAEAVLAPVLPAARAALPPGDRWLLLLGSSEGSVDFDRNRIDRAALRFRDLAAVAEASLGADHPTTLVLKDNLAAAFLELGRKAEAEQLARANLAAMRTRLDPGHIDLLRASQRLVRVLVERGDYAEARRIAEQANADALVSLPADHPERANVIRSLAGVYQYQERYAEAIELQEQAYSALAGRLGDRAPLTIDALQDLATSYYFTGRAAEAEPMMALTAAERLRQFGPGHPSSIIATFRHGEVLWQLSRFDEGLALVQQARAQAIESLGPEARLTFVTALMEARFLALYNRVAEAEALLAPVVPRAEALFGTDDELTFRAAAELAGYRLQLPDRAATAVEPAALVVNALNRRQRAAGDDPLGREARERDRQQTAPLRTLLADAMWVFAQTNSRLAGSFTRAAFTELQSVTSSAAERAVLRNAAQRAAQAAGGDAARLVSERERLERAWREADAAVDPAIVVPDERRAAIGALQARIEAEIAAVDARIDAAFPAYRDLIDPRPVQGRDAQALLAEDEALVQIVPTDHGTHVFVITRTSGRWLRAAITTTDVDAIVRRLLWDLGAPVEVALDEAARWQEAAGGGYPFARAEAHRLYSELLQPFESDLAGKRHLFVVASGSLSRLPLGVLVTAPPQGRDGDPAALRSTQWLADRHALIAVPSVRSLALLRRAAAPQAAVDRRQSFAGFGDPLLEGEAQTRGGGRGATRGTPIGAASVFAGAEGSAATGEPLANVAELKRMARLPGTARELADLRQALGAPASAVRLGERATESAVRSADLSRVRILALATHGLTAGEVDGAIEPGLVFTPPARATAADDGLLTASEIAALRLDADWVILSACNTAAGDGSAGAPGLSGLAQAFFFAGAQTLLASHWPVRDDVAARLTVRTIEIQRDAPALSRAEAFQRAMREIRNDAAHDSPIDSWAHPNAWAPFSLIGDGAR